MLASKQAWEQLSAPDHTWIPLPFYRGQGISAAAATKVNQERRPFPGWLVTAGELLSTVYYFSSDLLPWGRSWLIVYQNQLLLPVALLPLSALMSCKLHAEADLREEALQTQPKANAPCSSLCLPCLGWHWFLRPFSGSSKLPSTSWSDGRGDKTKWIFHPTKMPVVLLHIYFVHNRQFKTFYVGVLNVVQGWTFSQEDCVWVCTYICATSHELHRTQFIISYPT